MNQKEGDEASKENWQFGVAAIDTFTASDYLLGNSMDNVEGMLKLLMNNPYNIRVWKIPTDVTQPGSTEQNLPGARKFRKEAAASLVRSFSARSTVKANRALMRDSRRGLKPRNISLSAERHRVIDKSVGTSTTGSSKSASESALNRPRPKMLVLQEPPMRTDRTPSTEITRAFRSTELPIPAQEVSPGRACKGRQLLRTARMSPKRGGMSPTEAFMSADLLTARSPASGLTGKLKNLEVESRVGQLETLRTARAYSAERQFCPLSGELSNSLSSEVGQRERKRGPKTPTEAFMNADLLTARESSSMSSVQKSTSTEGVLGRSKDSLFLHKNSRIRRLQPLDSDSKIHRIFVSSISPNVNTARSYTGLAFRPPSPRTSPMTPPRSPRTRKRRKRYTESANEYEVRTALPPEGESSSTSLSSDSGSQSSGTDISQRAPRLHGPTKPPFGVRESSGVTTTHKDSEATLKTAASRIQRSPLWRRKTNVDAAVSRAPSSRNLQKLNLRQDRTVLPSLVVPISSAQQHPFDEQRPVQFPRTRSAEVQTRQDSSDVLQQFRRSRAVSEERPKKQKLLVAYSAEAPKMRPAVGSQKKAHAGLTPPLEAIVRSRFQRFPERSRFKRFKQGAKSTSTGRTDSIRKLEQTPLEAIVRSRFQRFPERSRFKRFTQGAESTATGRTDSIRNRIAQSHSAISGPSETQVSEDTASSKERTPLEAVVRSRFQRFPERSRFKRFTQGVESTTTGRTGSIRKLTGQSHSAISGPSKTQVSEDTVSSKERTPLEAVVRSRFQRFPERSRFKRFTQGVEWTTTGGMDAVRNLTAQSHTIKRSAISELSSTQVSEDTVSSNERTSSHWLEKSRTLGRSRSVPPGQTSLFIIPVPSKFTKGSKTPSAKTEVHSEKTTTSKLSDSKTKQTSVVIQAKGENNLMIEMKINFQMKDANNEHNLVAKRILVKGHEVHPEGGIYRL